MGLAQKKIKQRIPQNPRNISWTRDSGGLGMKMLEKMGWKDGSGLGTSGDGIITPITPVVRSEESSMEGIGLNDVKKEQSTAWEDNIRSYDAMLRAMSQQQSDRKEKCTNSKKESIHGKSHRKKFIRAKLQATLHKEGLSEILAIRSTSKDS
jgi:Pin2-interacting protein X1